jgi:hypothetical protein
LPAYNYISYVTFVGIDTPIAAPDMKASINTTAEGTQVKKE